MSVRQYELKQLLQQLDALSVELHEALSLVEKTPYQHIDEQSAETKNYFLASSAPLAASVSKADIIKSISDYLTIQLQS